MAQLKINVHDLHKSYGKNEVLKGITAKFYEGDVVCIIGPSGSGKSTFLRTMNLLETITSGQVTVDGYDLTDPKTDVDAFRSNVGMVFQHFNLFPHMSVLDNITFAPIEHKLMDKSEAEKVCMELLEKVGLADKRDAMPDSLSGGQKQRTSIARALLKKASILILDDSLSAVDTDTEDNILANLKKHHSDKTVIMIAHRVSTIRNADHILVLDKGETLEYGTFDELMALNGTFKAMYDKQQLEKQLAMQG